MAQPSPQISRDVDCFVKLVRVADVKGQIEHMYSTPITNQQVFDRHKSERSRSTST